MNDLLSLIEVLYTSINDNLNSATSDGNERTIVHEHGDNTLKNTVMDGIYSVGVINDTNNEPRRIGLTNSSRFVACGCI